MKVRVLFFAGLKEMFGPGRTVEVPAGSSVGEVARALMASSEEAARWPVLYAVNENFETPEKVLRDGDHLAVMTPMSGG